MSQHFHPAYENPQDLIALTLILHCRRQPRPQKWLLRSGKISKFTFPRVPPSVKQLKYSYKSLFCSLLSEKNLRILRKRRLLPHFGPGVRNEIQSLTVSEVNFIPEKRDTFLCKHITSFSAQCLNRILKEAKKLRSFVLEPRWNRSNFKAIRKARRLKNLTLKIRTKHILAYPGLFKGLTSLQKVTLSVRFSYDDHQAEVSKFFGCLLNLPRLQHLTLWLKDGLDYFKTLLSEIGRKRLFSFLIVVFDTIELPLRFLSWGNWIDSLYIGKVESFEAQKQYWPAPKKPERRLMLNSLSRIDDLVNENTTIKTLDIIDFYSYFERPSVEFAENLLALISRTKTLENLTITHKSIFEDYSKVISDFHNKLSQMESLENLKTFAFQLENISERAPMISPPYSSKMKNLKTLTISIEGTYFYLLDLHHFIEALKDLRSLENLSFEYHELANSSLRIHWDLLPLDWLPILKSISLHCSDLFSGTCIDQLFEKISRRENLESLKISGGILQKLDRKKASELVKYLCEKKNFEIVKCTWWRPGSCGEPIVSIQKIKKEGLTMVV